MARGRTISIFLRIALACSFLVLLFGTIQSVAHGANFGVGDAVEVTANLNVRTGPGTSYPEITDPDYHDYAPAGTRGEVVDGPSSADGYTWWQVNFGPGLYSGWSVEGGLEKVASTVSASINSYSPSSLVEVTVGDPTGISVTFTNTGDTAWNFIAGATVWDSGGSQVANYSKTLSSALQPGQQTTVNWAHSVSQAGDYWLQFGVWKATPYTAENLLDKKPSPSQNLIRGMAPVNQPPTCSVTANPSSGDAPLNVTFSLSASDPDGSITAWVLDVNGDGDADYSGTGNPPSTISHTYNSPGGYSVVLMVSDNDEASANDTESVNVGSTNNPPNCTLSANPNSGTVPLMVTFSINANDPDGSVTTWVLDADGNGSTDYSGSGNPPSTQSHTYETPGNYTAVLMISDNDDATASDTAAINVSASGQPVLSCSPTSFSFSAVKNGANPNNQNLSIWNSDEGTLNWTVSDGASWLNLSPTTGSSTGEMDTVTVSASISGKDAGTYDTVITVSASGAENAPQNIPVTLTITDSDIVTFPDTHLEAAIRDTLGKSTGDITKTDLAGITILSAPYNSISNLSGLEYCTSLSELNLLNNSVTDIGPLSGCTQLYLLTLTGNQVTDISPLAGLPALKLVYLGRNQISDVSPLGGLQYLQRVVLFSNRVSDILPLVQNTGIGSGEEVDLRTNPLSETSISTYIPQLQARGVNVLFDATISIMHDPTSLTFTAVKGEDNPSSQTISIWRGGGGGALSWTASSDVGWLILSPTSGSSTDEYDTITVSVNIAGMESGEYQANITLSASGATNSPQTVSVTLTINDSTQPDLVIETITWTPQNPSIGDIVTFTVSIKNRGGTQAGSSYVYYFIDSSQHSYDSVYSITPGASKTETFTWQVREGVHTIVAVADYRGQITESNESNNEKTISLSPTLSDLIVQSITWTPEHPSVGDTVTFTVTIKNQGNGDAASSKVYYFVDESQRGYDSVYSLNAGEATTETFTWTAEEGTHLIRAVSDYTNVVTESDESNNEKTITYSATALPDLIIQSIDMTPEKPEAGDSVTFAVTVINHGAGDAGSSKVYYFIDNIQQDYDSVYALSAGSTTTETFSWTMTEDSHVFKAFIDYDNEVPESNEENNEKTVTIGSPDVSVEIDSYSPPAPVEVKAGEAVTLGVTFTNTGNTAWTFYGAASLRRPDGTEEHLQPKPVPLAPGEQGSTTWSYTVDREGGWDIVFGIWNEEEQINSLAHSGWLNDYIICTEIGQVILTQPVHITPPEPYFAGDYLTATFTVKNIGAAAITLDKLLLGGRFYGGELPTGGYPDFTYESVTLQPGDTHRYEGTFTILESGSYGFFVAYYMDNPTEAEKQFLDENNWNTAIELGAELTDADRTRQITVIGQKLAARVEVDKTSVKSGELVTFDGSGSTGQIVSHEWSFDDGTIVHGSGNPGIETHRFRGVPDGPKTYTATLTVEVSSGATKTNSRDITVTPLEKPVEITHEPTMPIPNQPVFARMTVSYNWVDERNGESVYIVSRVNLSCDGFAGIYAFNFIDTHSRADRWDTPTAHPLLWWDLLPSLVKEKSYGPDAFEGFEFFREEVYGNDVFRGIEVYGSDIMFIAAYGYAGIHWDYAVPFVEWNSRDFRPESTEAPNVPIDINNLNLAHLSSPGELRVYDSQDRVTGLVGGEVKEEIPNSIYDEQNKIVVIYLPSDTYRYEVVGTDEGTYGINIASVEEGKVTSVGVTDAATSERAVHQYTINWDALSKGEPSIGIQIDADGDQVFEQVKIVQPPIASFIFSPISALTNENISFDASGSRDVDGEIISHKWNFGDGKASTGKVVKHTYAEPGEYAVVLAVIDNDGLLSTYSTVVQVDQGKEGGFPTWAWICIVVFVVIACSIAIWRYSPIKIGHSYVAMRNKLKYILRARNKHNGSTDL